MNENNNIMNRFEHRMKDHDKRVEPRQKALEKAEKKIEENPKEIPEAEVNQRIDYNLGVDPNGMLVLRFMANGKPIKLSSMTFDTNGAMELANNLVKVVRAYKSQRQALPT
jgi:hypothetical protein